VQQFPPKAVPVCLLDGQRSRAPGGAHAPNGRPGAWVQRKEETLGFEVLVQLDPTDARLHNDVHVTRIQPLHSLEERRQIHCVAEPPGQVKEVLQIRLRSVLVSKIGAQIEDKLPQLVGTPCILKSRISLKGHCHCTSDKGSFKGAQFCTVSLCGKMDPCTLALDSFQLF
jgi:hypothetical protein